jgi:predicted metal-dependent phosphoesterase TrpH
MNLQKFTNISRFRQSLDTVVAELLAGSLNRYPLEECLKIDLHCHDKNSDNPDELWGRILGLPETWLKTDKLVQCLHESGCDALTITNHNNARSCWKLLDKGVDVLVAAEFTCYFPEYSIFVHVLAYGFNKKQEKTLNRLRQDIYKFLRYAHKKISRSFFRTRCISIPAMT